MPVSATGRFTSMECCSSSVKSLRFSMPPPVASRQ
jgi:hypothetical protein